MMSGLGNYIAECARLLYWTYFKPYTLQQWLSDIYPDLNSFDNPYQKLKQDPRNKLLRRYAEQVFWLVTVTPQLSILLIGLIYTSVTQESFDWLISESFVPGWIFGQIIPRYRSGFRGRNLYFIAIGNFILTLALLAWGVAFNVVFNVVFGVAFGVVSGAVYSVVYIVVFGVAFSVAWGAAYSVVLGVIYSLAWGVVFSVVWSVVYSMVYGVALHVALVVVWGVVSGVAWGAAYSVAWGVVYSAALVVVLGVASGAVSVAVWGVVFSVVFNVVLGVAFGVALGVAFVFGVLRIYFWFPEFLWVGLMFLFTAKGKFASRLRYLPPYYDQLIYLPLPFISTMLVEAYREKPQAARKTITYLTNSTNQQKVAAKAIVNIALDTLERCQNLRDIMTISEELAWIPNPSPPEIATVLPQFLDLSRSVQSADMATSIYRKAEILKNPLDSLSQMQTSFAFIKNPRVATTASNIAQKWLSILETARRNLQEQSRYAQEIPQVYIAGAALDPKTAQSRFKGRQDIFREIENIALMSPPPTLLLYGGRRTGKTSTLKYLPKKVGGDLIPLRVNVQGIAKAMTLSGVAQSLVQQIIDSARISRNLNLPYPKEEKLKHEPFLTLLDWFTVIEGIAPGKRFLLCLDEFERLEKIISTTNSYAPLDFLREVIEDRAAWTLLFSGSHTLDEIEDYWSDYLINTRSVRVTYLEPPEAEELILHPVPEFPDIYLPATVNRIIYWTRCQPYLVQLLCSELVDYLNREHPQNALNIKATPQDVDNIIDKALIAGSAYFDELWKNTLNAQQRESIRNLVHQAQPTTGDRKIWRKLIQKEILQFENGDRVSFQVPLIARSIIQKISEEL